ncbi:MAG: hypothetical protein LBP63_00930 [Prevotellaceae bacterium]|jgi:hypothetical protein|nr:hypothetical protein [Prevotellaceae bacterium]
MKLIIKKIALVIAAVFLFNNAFAQSEAKNVIRVGAGANFSDHVSGEKYSAGTALETEYQRTLSKYIGLTFNLSTKSLHYGKYHDVSDISYALGAMVTPFPDNFRWIKVGAGLASRHYVNSWATEVPIGDSDYRYNVIYYRNSGDVIGIDFVGRLYVIDNSKYELFASYRLKTSFNSGLQMNNALLCLCFGVKF